MSAIDSRCDAPSQVLANSTILSSRPRERIKRAQPAMIFRETQTDVLVPRRPAGARAGRQFRTQVFSDEKDWPPAHALGAQHGYGRLEITNPRVYAALGLRVRQSL
jgi:hypothetical protein